MSRTRVLIVDDHPVVCEGIRSLLAGCDDVQVIGQAEDGQQALACVEELLPDVVIMDIAMPRMNGIDATRLIRSAHPEIRILILTQFEDPQYVLPLLKSGANGIIIKRAVVSDLINAVHAVARGETFLYPAVATAIVDEITHQASATPSIPKPLSVRELQILEHVVMGESSAQIATALCLSTRTVEFHRANLMRKMGVHNVVDLVREALRHGLVAQGS